MTVIGPRVIGLRNDVHPLQQGRGLDESEGRIADELKNRQPCDEEHEEEPLIGKATPAIEEFKSEFLKNSGVLGFFH